MATKNKLFSFSEYKRIYDQRFKQNVNSIAPYTVLLLVASILFFLSMMFSFEKTFIKKINLDILRTKPTAINIPVENTIYVFEVEQAFSSQVPSYSELEIELLDNNFNHIYTVYKSLWQEKHENDDGNMSVYSDKILEFEIDLQKKARYHIRAISYNGNKTKISLKLYKKKGSLYFPIFLFIFMILLIILLISFDRIPGIDTLLPALRKTKITKTFIIAVIIVIFVFISCVVISYTHYGYPHSGDEIKLPTYFFNTKDVHYLG
jgi:hypothetical protein